MTTKRIKELAAANPVSMPVLLTKEELMEMNKTFIQDIELELAGDVIPQAATQASINSAGSTLAVSDRSDWALRKRAYLKQVMDDIEVEVLRLRKAVQGAEATARRFEGRLALMKLSIRTYMEQRGILEVPTALGYFKLGDQPDKLVVDDESLLPREYFDEEAVIVSSLNKDRLTAALDAGKEVPGAHLERNRHNLLIR